MTASTTAATDPPPLLARLGLVRLRRAAGAQDRRSFALALRRARRSGRRPARHRRARPAPPWSRSACRPQPTRGRSPCRRPGRPRGGGGARHRHTRVGQLRDPGRTEPGDGGGVLELRHDQRQGRGRRQRGRQRTQPGRQAGGVQAGRHIGRGGTGQHVVQRAQQLVVRQGLPDTGGQRPHGGVLHEGHHPRHGLIQNQRQRVDVGPAVDGLPLGRLGAYVSSGPDHRSRRLGPGRLRQGAGHAEVGHPDPALLVEEQVGRLDVPVHQSAQVRVGQTLRHLGPELGRLGKRQPYVTIQQVTKGAATEIFQNQIGPVGVLAPVEDAQHVRVVQAMRPSAPRPGSASGRPRPSPTRVGEP